MQDVTPERCIIRQVIDIPEMKIKVIEHRSEVKKCPKCRRKNTGKFPEGIANTVQYGENVKAVAVYLTQYQLIPCKRGTELKNEVDLNWNTDNALKLDKIEAFEERSSKILEDGFKEDYIKNSETYSKKKAKKSTSLNLIPRFLVFKIISNINLITIAE